jgi:DNA-binding MarR family transcriptional regulator
MSTSKQFSEVLREWTETFMHRSFHDFKRFMDESGLSSSHVNALMRLYHGSACGVSDIGDHMGITNAAASQMVDRLVQMGLLARAENPNDRRVKQLTITDQGRALVEQGVEARSRWMAELTNALTPEQQKEITSALVILTEAARKMK